MDAQEPLAGGAPAPAASLLALPIELVAEILSSLPVRALAAVDGVCVSFHAMARCDRLWRHLYRRDFGRTDPPDQHTDAASHGRGFRWLYMIEVARQRKRPLYLSNGRYVGIVPSSDGVTCESGEWAVTFDGRDNGVPRLVLDGYATATYAVPNEVAVGKSGTRAVDPDIRSRQGIWRAGAFVGPGLAVGHDGIRYRADHFGPSGIRGQGQVDYGGDRYVGSLDGLVRHGAGTYVWPVGQRFYGEWASGRRDGRGVTWDINGIKSKCHAGQLVESKYAGTGVSRDADGAIRQSIWAAFAKPLVYVVERKPHPDAHLNHRLAVSVTRTVRPDSDDWRTDHIDIHGRVFVRTKDGVRVSGAASAHAVVGGPAHMILTAIDDDNADPRLAGRRIWGHGWTATANTRPRDFGTLPLDPHSHDARLWALYLTSPHCLVDPEVAANCVRALAARATQASVSLDWRSPKDDYGDPTTVGMGLPFGQVLSIEAGKEGVDKFVSRPRVRCFLTGALVPAADCDFVPSGRLYARDRLAMWHSVAGPHRDTDPETGIGLCAGGDWRMPWCAWMARVCPHLLAWAVRDTSARYPGWPVLGAERVRAIVAETTGALDERRTSTTDPWAAVASGMSLAAPGPTDNHLLAGFDALVIGHAEVRHPAWDPRGSWRLGTPADAPVDPTLQPFETDDRDPAPTAYLDSHGVVMADIGTASFLGSRLTAVHFFGQRFDGASFAGASLTACVFVDCQFRQTAFFGAVLGGGCVFHGCFAVDTGAHMGQEAIVERIRSVGVL
nr:morn repeat incomplete domain containing protein [Pandoravirus belohorizontensis]